jgi:hypothetical protein
MKRLLIVPALLFAALAARADNAAVRVNESVTIEIAGVTAAYAVDATIVDVTMARAGHIALTGRKAGTTQLIAVTAGGTTAFLLTVGPARVTAVPRAMASNEPKGQLETRYSSDTSRIQNSFDVFMRDGERLSQLHLVNVRYLGQRFGGSSTAFPSMFYRVTTANRELTLLDDFVDVSPLTIRGTQVRGIHLHDHALEIHAGYAAATMYEDLFLPSDRRWVAGAGYSIDRGGIRWTPSIYGFFSKPGNSTARRGVAATLAGEYVRTDALTVRGEVGFSGAVAASADVRFETQRNHLFGHLTVKPSDYPTLGLSDTAGTHGQFEWTRRATERLTTETFATYDDYRLQLNRQTFSNGSFLLRYAATPHVTLTTGAAVTDLRTPTRSVRTIALPAGIAYDAKSFGASLSGRILDNDNASRRGDVIRLGARASRSAFTTSFWIERQRQAPTLDLIFGQEPGLALALQRLGISVHSPEDVSRVLRDNAALINLGYIDGVTVNLTPLRWQAGFDAVWSGKGEGRDQIHFHAIADRDENIGATRTNALGTLSYSRRIFRQTDVFGSLSWWRGGIRLFEQDGKAVEAGVRQRFDGVPAVLQRNIAIEGVAFFDPEMRGAAAGAAPVPNVIVVLDGTRSTRTDAKGAYSFRDVAAGSHSVVAQLPASRAAFFTTASNVEVSGGKAHVDFGLVWSSARLNGRVTSDANVGIAGLIIAAIGSNDTRATATTDSDGSFVLPVPPGSYRVILNPESLPSGYATDAKEESFTLVADQPRSTAFAIRALRSVAGTAAGAHEVTIASLGRSAPVDAAGNFIFRSLPSGQFALAARIDGRVVQHEVTLPAEPTIISDVNLSAVPAAVVTTPSPVVRPSQSKAFVVQIGAFSEPANARELSARLMRLGEDPFTDLRNGLMLVRTGPFASRAVATVASQHLRRAGIDGYVVPR